MEKYTVAKFACGGSDPINVDRLVASSPEDALRLCYANSTDGFVAAYAGHLDVNGRSEAIATGQVDDGVLTINEPSL